MEEVIVVVLMIAMAVVRVMMVVALVELRGDAADAELREHARGGLAGYKVPKHFVVLDSETTGLNPRVDRLILSRLLFDAAALEAWWLQSRRLLRTNHPSSWVPSMLLLQVAQQLERWGDA